MRLSISLALLVVLASSRSSAQVSKAQQNAKVDQQVASLIEKMVHKRTEHKAFADLEALGCPAVPFIIQRMDDRRKLTDPTISLENPPNAFEGLRHYNPEEVVDALAAILNQLTGQNFGFI